MKILITSGATREPIDGVRFITNFSTGETGASLADHLSDRGHEVTLLCGNGAARPRRTPEVRLFESFEDLNRLLEETLARRRFGAIIHAAAVSDYSVRSIHAVGPATGDAAQADVQPMLPLVTGKLDSAAEEIELRLTRNFKIVDRLRAYAAVGKPERPPIIVAFKLTRTEVPEERLAAVARLASHSGADLIVHNDLGDIRREGEHRFRLFAAAEPATPLRVCASRQELAASLHEILRAVTSTPPSASGAGREAGGLQ